MLSKIKKPLAFTAALITAAVMGFGTYADSADSVIISNGGGAAVTGQTDGTGFAAKLYNAENGLPTSDANTIFTSSDGFIWIGGYSGLIRYDGTSFERQDSSDGITNVNALFEDSLGRLWAGTNDNGIVVRDKDFSKHFTYKNGLRSSSIRTISEDSSGNIIVGTTLGIYYVDTELELHALNEPQLENAYIICLYADPYGSICGTTKSGAFFRIKDLRVTNFYNGNDLISDPVTTVRPDPDEPDAIYIGTESGLICHGSFGAQFTDMTVSEVSCEVNVPGENGPAVTKVSAVGVNMIQFASGRLWVITDSLIFWRDEDGSFHVLENMPLNSGIEDMIEDYEGNLWFSSSRQGIMKIAANKFTDINEQAGLEKRVVNSTCIHNERLYIGTDSGLQIIDKNKNIIENELTELLDGTRIRCITEDADNNIWISTYTNDKGLIRFSESSGIVSYTEQNGLPSNKARCTFTAPDGTVLAATNGGLSVISGGKIQKNIGAESGIRNTVILTAATDSGGRYFLGTDGDGIYVADGNNISHLGLEDGLTSDVILRIKEDSERGVLWIITSNSIEFYKDGTINKVKNFPYTNNYDIYFDKTGNAWVLSSNGIYVANADEMINGGSYDYMYYGIADGLPSVPTGNSFSFSDDNGDLFISGRDGVSRVNIDRYFEQTHDIKFIVTYIEANDKKYYPDSSNTVRLPISAKNITVYSYALTYSLHDPEIQYYLDGADEKPTTLEKSDMTPVRYTNLHGGEYSYTLSLINNSTHDIQQTMLLRIIKERDFYEQIWFYVVCTVLIALILWIIIKSYIDHKTRVFLKKEEEDRILIRDIAEAFSRTIDLKDKYTNGHSKRVAEYTAMLTKELGYDEKTVNKFYNIALLHDIGKIGIPAEVLNKPGKLTDEEFDIIKSHAKIGYEVLKDISIMPELAVGAGSHHERPDGKGYPNGLKGNKIPRVAQIIAVADTFDAMYSNRPYRKRMNFKKVVSIIKEVSGTQLTPDVVDAFLRLVDKGLLRAPDDHGGGSMDDIDNIHKKLNGKPLEQEQEKEE